ncbi:SurA N-terminal domain-containing protein [Thalassotalea aquiviva]|uniref:SurA N-terminal domain-containing protein n=1 Tax=Thalassotalea aquiviva TaxID=3242415 RepID=UPI003529E8AF
MLEKIREGSGGPAAKIILGLVIATFIFAGVGSYTNSVDTSAAKVNDVKISQQEFERAYQNQRARMKQQFGDMFEQIASNDAFIQNMRSDVLEQLINEALLEQNARDLEISISDEQVKEAITAMPEFQVDGQFDYDRYVMLINQAGFRQSSDFGDYLRVDMARRQLMNSIMASEISLPYQQELAAKLANQTRDIRYATISAQQFVEGIEVTDTEIEQFYQSNQPRFATQEQVQLEYVALNIEDLAAEVEVTDEQVKAFYDNNLSSFQSEERRRASHILVEFGDDEDAAKAQAEEILVKVKAGEDFATLAQQYSDDTFSGENGGDLDWFGRGAMDVAFEDAAFALTLEDNISEVVKSDFGFHIIKLTDYAPIDTKPFAEVAQEIKTQLVNNQALEQFYELQGQMAEVAFESAESLDDVAAVFNGEIKTSAWLARMGNFAPFDNANIVDAAFSSELIVDGLNSDVIEVENDKLVMVIRVAQHKAADTKPLEDVRDSIKAELINDKAATQATEVAQSLLEKLKAGENVDAELTTYQASFVRSDAVSRNSNEVARHIASQAFLLPHPVEGQISAGIATAVNGDIDLIEVINVNEGTVDESVNAQQLAMALSQAVFSSYVENLKKDAEITRNLPANAPQF